MTNFVEQTDYGYRIIMTKSPLLPIAILGAAMLNSCKNETESSNSMTVVVMDSQTPSMYQSPDTLAFIKQSILQNTDCNPESVEEMKMYFGNEGSRKSLLSIIVTHLNEADAMLDRLLHTDITYNNDAESLAKYCQQLAVACDTLASNQRRIYRVLNENYNDKNNFYYEIKFKNGSDWNGIGTITDNHCSNGNNELWDLSKMNR